MRSYPSGWSEHAGELLGVGAVGGAPREPGEGGVRDPKDVPDHGTILLVQDRAADLDGIVGPESGPIQVVKGMQRDD